MSRQTSLEERLQMVALSEGGLMDQAIAKKTGWSVSVVRKWRRRYKAEGRPGLASSLGRPTQGALSSYPKTVREQIHRMRQQHPGWGSNTIYMELCRAGKEPRIPAPGSIGRYLKEQGLTRRYQHILNCPIQSNPRSFVHTNCG